MKKLFTYIQGLLVVILVLSTSIYADSASIMDGLPLSALPIDGRENAYQKMASVTDGEKIVGFDYSDEMGILLVTSAEMSTEKHLRYLDKGGSVIAVFSFECPGEIGVAWDGVDICLFFTRGHVIEKIDYNGRLKERFSLNSINYETDKAWESLTHRETKQTDAGTYYLRTSGMSPIKGINEFTKLVYVERSSGHEQILYDAGATTSIQSWLHFVLIIGFIVFVITKIFKTYKRVNQNTSESSHN